MYTCEFNKGNKTFVSVTPLFIGTHTYKKHNNLQIEVSFKDLYSNVKVSKFKYETYQHQPTYYQGIFCEYRIRVL